MPDSFEDVAALIALYRPGPMSVNMHNDYADRKNGRKPVEYFHPDAEALLAPVMEADRGVALARVFAGADAIVAACRCAASARAPMPAPARVRARLRSP